MDPSGIEHSVRLRQVKVLAKRTGFNSFISGCDHHKPPSLTVKVEFSVRQHRTRAFSGTHGFIREGPQKERSILGLRAMLTSLQSKGKGKDASSTFAKKLGKQKDEAESLSSASLDTLYKDIDWVVECSREELLDLLRQVEDEQDPEWLETKQTVEKALEPIAASTATLVTKVVEELQLSLKDKLKAHDKALDEKLERSRKASQTQLKHAEADFRGREKTQLEIEQKIVERIMGGMSEALAGEKEGEESEQGKILAEAFERQAQLLHDIANLTVANGELRAENENGRHERIILEGKLAEALKVIAAGSSLWLLMAADCHTQGDRCRRLLMAADGC